MNFDPENFRAEKYEETELYFDKSCAFHSHFGHKQKTKAFRYYRNIIGFLRANVGVKIYFTLNDAVASFIREGDCLIVNMKAYQNFCSTIGVKTGGRFRAFIGQNLSLRDVSVSDTEKSAYIRNNASEDDLIEVIKNLPADAQARMYETFQTLANKPTSSTSAVFETDPDKLISALAKFLKSEKLQNAFYAQLPSIQIGILESHIRFLESNLDKNEKFIQNWLDEENGRYRKQRCLIFGLEYVDPIREGQIASKRFDVLAEQDFEHHVIFELKSPKDEVFKVEQHATSAGGISTEYHLSAALSRAIPEVLGYRKMYKEAHSEELEKMGIKVRKPVSKCVIVIGTSKNDLVWRENFERVRNSLNGIELLTYNHLIDRLRNTVQNLVLNTISQEASELQKQPDGVQPLANAG